MHAQPLVHRRRFVLGLATTLAAAMAVALPGPAAAAAPALEAAWLHFDQAQAGQSGAAEQAAQDFNALLRAQPGHPVLMAYAGSATAMQARGTWLPWKKLAWAEDGLALLDKALALLTPAHDAPMLRGTPGSLETKFIAATTFLAVPGFMNRGARGGKLLAEVLASPLLAASPLPFRGTVWMRAARQAQDEGRADEARRLYGQVVSTGAPQADAARAALGTVAS